MPTPRRAPFLILSLLLLLALGGLLFWKYTSPPIELSPADPFESDPQLGSSEAPITMIEYSDFQCPYCRIFFNETYPQIKENYIDTGKVQLIYMHFPLTSIHEDALPASLASECAYEQGGNEVFFAYHDMIYQGQNEYGIGTAPISDEVLMSYAEILKLDMEEFESCFAEQSYFEEVKADFEEGAELGIGTIEDTGTPTFFINGEMISGARSYETFVEIFEEILSEE